MNSGIPIILLSVGVLTAVAGSGGCGGCDSSKGGRMAGKSIEQVQAECTDEWMAIPGVEGVAIGLLGDKPCIKIFSSKKAEELQGKIPSVVEGHPVIIEETGTFRARDRQ